MKISLQQHKSTLARILDYIGVIVGWYFCLWFWLL